MCSSWLFERLFEHAYAIKCGMAFFEKVFQHPHFSSYICSDAASALHMKGFTSFNKIPLVVGIMFFFFFGAGKDTFIEMRTGGGYIHHQQE